jgi:hypothetical protein
MIPNHELRYLVLNKNIVELEMDELREPLTRFYIKSDKLKNLKINKIGFIKLEEFKNL